MGKKTEKPNTLVLDPKQGWGFEHVENPSGHRRRYGKSLVYLMERRYSGNGDGEDKGTLAPYELPPKLGETPEKLYRALFWENEAGILFTLQNTLLEKFRVIAVYIMIGILLLFIFLIFSSLL